MPSTKTVTLHLTADPNLQVRQQIRNGDKFQVIPAKRIRFRSARGFSLTLSPTSPFVDGADSIDAVQRGEEWLVDAAFRPDAANVSTAYTVAVHQAAAMAAQSPATSAAAPQVEIILEQY